MNKTKIIGGLIGAAALAATALIIPFEGKRTVTYLDPPGIPTICYGHTSGVKLGQIASDSDCVAFLESDIKIVDEALNRLIKVPVSDKYKAALISFTFNVGQGNFAKSTLLKKLNAGDKVGACNQIVRWVYVGKIKYEGLMRRRIQEKALCLEGIQ